MIRSETVSSPKPNNSLLLKNDIDMIIDGLYLGNFEAVLNPERLRRLVSSHFYRHCYNNNINYRLTEHLARPSPGLPTPERL